MTEPTALAARFLAKNPVYHLTIGGTDLVVLTDPSGANRVYQTGGRRFVEWDGDRTTTEENGTAWTLTESRLEAQDGDMLARFPAHRAFWFGWAAAYEDTRLVK